MAPKPTSKSTKQALILDHIRATRTCHTLKDLEKSLPPIAGINSIQVKEYVQALVDDGKLRVEKIGSGNWYWCFGSEERKCNERRRNELLKEVERVRKGLFETEKGLNVEKEKRRRPTMRKTRKRKRKRGSDGDDEEADGEGGGGEDGAGTGDGDDGDGDDDDDDDDDDDEELKRLVTKKAELEAEVKRLRAEEAAGREGCIETKKADVAQWKEMAAMWTDNIYILEEYLMKITGGDREMVDAVKRECYGEEFVEGEGLRELSVD